MVFQVGDIVARKSYGADVHFRIIGMDQQKGQAYLKGIDMRLLADAPFSDLVLVQEDLRTMYKEKEEQQMSSSVKEIKEQRGQGQAFFQLPGRVLHIDGDTHYLKKCLTLYKELNIPAYGIHIAEKEMPKYVVSLLTKVKPDILVLTGHDAFMKSGYDKYEIKAYRNSIYFRDAVLRAREYEKSRDDLIIFSGACQSYFEALIQAGANYASSPQRVNIHAVDPVYIVEKACYTSINQIINLQEVLNYSITGSAGLGGIDTRGTYRSGKPSSS